MVSAISLVTLLGGIVLFIFGVSSAQSLSSDFSNLFTGFPTDKSMWMLAGGVVLSVMGLAGLGQGKVTH